jgi:hypothetical protein
MLLRHLRHWRLCGGAYLVRSGLIRPSQAATTFPLLFAFRLILYTTLIQTSQPHLALSLIGDNDLTTHERVMSTLSNEDDTKASRSRRYGKHFFLSGARLQPRIFATWKRTFHSAKTFADPLVPIPLGIERISPVFLCGLIVIAWIQCEQDRRSDARKSFLCCIAGGAAFGQIVTSSFYCSSSSAISSEC